MEPPEQLNRSAVICQSGKKPLAMRIFIAGFIISLYLFGYAHWMLFFNMGAESSFGTAYDWGKEFRYYTVLQEALQKGVIPYHMKKIEHHTDRLLGIPEVIVSPQVILLKYMDVGHFIVANTLLLYTLGFLGCWLLKERYRLSLLPFTVLYVMFNFNGHIISHLGAGHAIWTGYFLLPFFMLLVLRLLEEKNTNYLWAPLSLLLMGIMLQGCFHLFNWCVILLGLLALCRRELMKTIILAIVAGLLLSSCRLWPAIMTMWNSPNHYMNGFPTVMDMLYGLIDLRGPDSPIVGGYFGNVGWVECDFYVGAIGLLILVYFGIYLGIKKLPHLDRWRYQDMNLPLALMTMLSFDYFMTIFSLLHIPLAGTERVTTRFFLLPFLFIMLFACIRMEYGFCRLRLGRWMHFFAWAALLKMAFTLLDHSYLWQSIKIKDGVVARYGWDGVNSLAVRGNDATFKIVLNLSFIASATFIVLVAGYWLWSVVTRKRLAARDA
jgi:hypothetical protein